MTRCNHSTRLARFLDGDLRPGAAAQVEAHLVDCLACRGERRRILGLRELLRRAAPPPLNDAEWDGLWQSIRAGITGDTEPALPDPAAAPLLDLALAPRS